MCCNFIYPENHYASQDTHYFYDLNSFKFVMVCFITLVQLSCRMFHGSLRSACASCCGVEWYLLHCPFLSEGPSLLLVSFLDI